MRAWFRFVRALGALVLVALPAGALAQIRDDREALKTLKVPDGFEVRLFAGSDICHNPTAIDVDIYGRVWVAEGVNYRSILNKRGSPGPLDPTADRIKVLEDVDGDGRADMATVFIEKIPITPMSICVAGDQAFVGVAPQFWRFDGAAAKDPVGKTKTVLLDGFHRSGRKGPLWVDHDHALHSLLLGPDGRMYFTIGDEGMDVVDNSGVRHKPNGAAMLRMNLDGTKMRVLADNFRNPYELDVDSFGRVFCSDNDDDGNAQVRICHVIDGGDYGYRHNPKLPPSPTRHHWREDVPGVTPKILRTFAGSPCGILVYEGKLLPERFRGSLIHCDSGAPQVVRAYHMKPSGAGFTCETENLVTSTDKWFRPVDVAHASDGSLYFADWYDPGVGGHGYQDKIIGRIYHLTMKGAPPPAKTPSPDLTTIPGLLSTLMSPMPSVRFLAIRKLREKGPEAATALTEMARNGKHPLERARALWVLFGMGDLGRPVILEMLKGADPRLRAQAVRMLREDLGRNLDAILPLAGDVDPEVRLEVTIALRDVPTTSATHAAFAALFARFEPKDPWYAPAFAAALRQREPALIKNLFGGSFLPEWVDRKLTLAWQLHRVECIPFLSEVLKKPAGAEQFQSALNALGWTNDLAAGEAVAAAAASDHDAAHRRAALETLARKIGGEWRALADKPVFNDLVSKGLNDTTLISATLAMAAAAQATEVVPQVLALLDRPGLERSVRRAALESLGQFRAPEALERLEKQLKAARLPEQPPANPPPTDELAFAAASALQTMNSPPANKLLEAAVLDWQYPTDLRREIVKLLGRTPAGCRFLLAAAEKEQLPVDMKGDATQVTNHSPDRRVRELAARVLPLPKLAGNRTLPPIPDILARRGDAKRGQAVFYKTESQCAKCHRVDGVGGWVGPDLSQIGGKLAKEGLLDSILNPSAAVAHEYVQYSVETNKGLVYAGLIVEETPDRLVLKNAEAERLVVPAREVSSKTPMQVSIMPEGLVQNFSDQDLVDLLAYLATLKQPAVTISEWHLAGPFEFNSSQGGPGTVVNLEETFAGKGGAKVGWRKLSTDREGRVDLEAALGTRQADAYLHASVQSKAAQRGRLVVLLPAGAKVRAWVNDKETVFQPGPKQSDPKAPVPSLAELPLAEGKNELLLRLAGTEQAAWAMVATVVSPQGVELATKP